MYNIRYYVMQPFFFHCAGNIKYCSIVTDDCNVGYAGGNIRIQFFLSVRTSLLYFFRLIFAAVKTRIQKLIQYAVLFLRSSRNKTLLDSIRSLFSVHANRCLLVPKPPKEKETEWRNASSYVCTSDIVKPAPVTI